MDKPKRSDDKYWTGTRDFDQFDYEDDLDEYICEIESNQYVLTKELTTLKQDNQAKNIHIQGLLTDISNGDYLIEEKNTKIAELEKGIEKVLHNFRTFTNYSKQDFYDETKHLLSKDRTK